MTDGATNTIPARGISPPALIQVLSRWSPLNTLEHRFSVQAIKGKINLSKKVYQDVKPY